jgi:farnesyl-diphosphate farnesyltransferase
MAIPDDVKIPLLRSFHEKSYDRGWTLSCGVGDYRDLMEKYTLVTDVFLNLDTEYQLVIADICKKMGNGMADFIPKKVETVEEYNLYCHYVAGLVGIGLSQLFASSGLESKVFFKYGDLANEMGLFLQKTNIIRDYLEDINEVPVPRMFWPKEIWGLYAEDLAEFKEPENADAAVKCLNHMVRSFLLASLYYCVRIHSPR